MSIFSKVIGWITGLFKKASDVIQDVVLPTTITITNALKSVLDADTVDLIGHIAGSAGVAFEDKLRAILTDIIPKLQLAQSFKGQDPNTILANILRLIGPSDAITKTAFWIEFSGMVASAWEDGKIDLAESATLLKYWYEHNSGQTPSVPGDNLPAPEEQTQDSPNSIQP